MACKKIVPVALIKISNQSFNPNNTCPYNLVTYYNAEVTNQVITGNGISVTLSDDVVNQIKAVYDGTPLIVDYHVVVETKCCQAAPCTFCGPTGGCTCTPTVFGPFIHVDTIFFGKKDKEAKCPGIVTACCLSCAMGPCAKMCCENRISIPSSAVTLTYFGSPAAGGPSVATMA